MNVSVREGAIVLAVDLGTTSAKVLAFDAESLRGGGRAAIRARAERAYPLLAPEPGAAELEPERIAEAAAEAVREAVAAAGCGPDGVLTVSFSTAMHALIAVDADGEALMRAMTWADVRAAGQARRLRESAEAADLAFRTGAPVHAMTPLAKLLWLREQRPELPASAARFIGIKEYVLERWFGRPVPMDESTAGGTGLYNLQERTWDGKALRIAGIGPDRLPDLKPATHLLRGLVPEAAARLGIRADVPVVLGAADGPLANLGGGALEPGVAALTIGTSGAVRVAVRRPAADPDGRLFCYPLAEGLWIAGGAVNSGGVVLRWLRDKLAPDLAGEGGDEGYARLVGLAMEAPAGAGGLLFLPHLAGERAPHGDERARGAFVGLALDHDRRHMLRAGLEGIVLNLRSVAEALERVTGEIREFRVSGGFVRSASVRQLIADVLGRPVVRTDSEDASALGAARLAMQALGLSRDPDPPPAAVTDRIRPNPDLAPVYDRIHGMFRRLYDRTADTFAELDRFRLDGCNPGP
ncbi:gluconokinase [Thermobacillus sp. ZCTH02-B1]|uniref:gluconokinase n=1 Tax=Thermobacillus sp. ZCTH02-B1 TaxID=1858795 RepID=UPI0025D78A2A|nr:gluconokinase [Thermobacillus sp. ZCTH02-B1]